MEIAAPTALSLASAGLDAGSKLVAGQGKAAAFEFEAQRAERAAEIGRLQADQADAQFRENLNTTLSNINAMRAAAYADPDSPTAVAIKANEASIGDRERVNKVTTLRMQAEEDEKAADFRRRAASSALLASYLSAAGGLAKAGASAAPALTRSGRPMSNASVDPTRAGALY